MKKEFVTLALSEIIPYENNPRINDEAVGDVVESIKQCENLDPIEVDENNIILAGHTRLKALQELGYTETECIRYSGLTEEQKKKYRLLSNKTGEKAEWDFDKLKIELAALDFGEFDFGFDLPEDEEDVEIVEVELPEEVETRCKPGDVWQLGEHRLICGDSTNITDVNILMNGKLADMVFTDPPWNVNYGAVEKGNAMGYKPRTIKNDFMGTDEFKEFMYNAFKSMNSASKEGAMTYVVMSAKEWGNMMLTLAQNDYYWSSTIIWNKDRLVRSRKDYHTKYEPIWYGWKGGSRLCPLKDRKQSDVWDFDRPSKSDEHPTMKPIPLVAKAIKNSSKKNNVVLDLFGGSGSTLIACEQLNRKCYMAELDEHYCDVILQRWENFTGKEAVLIGEGK